MTNQKNFVPQAKMVRLLTLIGLLSKKRMTVVEIAERFDVHVRTAYRYMDLFELSGIIIEKDFYNRYYIADMPVKELSPNRSYRWNISKQNPIIHENEKSKKDDGPTKGLKEQKKSCGKAYYKGANRTKQVQNFG